jgi:hypothetical protein
MIYFLFLYFIVGSFHMGSYYEYQNRDFILRDIPDYIFGLLFSPIIWVASIIYRIYKYYQNK